MQRAKNNGVKFNPEKVKLRLREVKYVSCILTANGLQPGPQIRGVILNMQKPEDVARVGRFLGTIQYLSNLFQLYLIVQHHSEVR